MLPTTGSLCTLWQMGGECRESSCPSQRPGRVHSILSNGITGCCTCMCAVATGDLPPARAQLRFIKRGCDLNKPQTAWACCGSAGLSWLFASEASLYQEPDYKDIAPFMQCPTRLAHSCATESMGLLLHLPLGPSLHLCGRHQSLFFIVRNSVEWIAKPSSISAIWEMTVKTIALSALSHASSVHT